jgi:calcium-activated chloride channel regulator 4
MVDNFERPDPEGVEDPFANDISLVFDPAKAGAILAHEWAHYAYGLRDEHRRKRLDIPVEPSLMNNPWRAPRDDDWANFSIARASGGAFESTGATPHHRQFGRSAWEVLSDTEIGLDEKLLAPVPGGVERRAQGLVAPVGPPASGESGALGVLEVLWRAPCSSYVIAIDNSGSMSGLPLARAKEAATALVDEMTADSTTLTVLTFHDSTIVRSGPFLVSDALDTNDESERDRFRFAIDQIASVPVQTKFSAGLGSALDEFDAIDALGACTGPISTTTLFFVSDGSNRPGEDLDALLTDYAARGVTIHPLNVGTSATSARDLVPLADQTGGIVFGPATGSRLALAALDESEAANKVTFVLAAGATRLKPKSSPIGFPVETDSTFDRLRVCVGSTGPVDLGFQSPSGTVFLPVFVRDPETKHERCNTYFSIDPGIGTWNVVAAPATTNPVDLTFEVIAVASRRTYTLDAWIANADDLGQVQHPAPMIIAATLWNERPIAGARLIARAKGQDKVELRDDGRSPDEIANDGRYVGVTSYPEAGCENEPGACIVVIATNKERNAKLTSKGLIVSPNRDGSPMEHPPVKKVRERFARAASIDVPTLPAPPPSPIIDTDPVDGRIKKGSVPHEIDVCAVLPNFATTPEPLEVRVSGAFGNMLPRLEVFLGDPSRKKTKSVTAKAGSGASGVAITIDEAALDCASPVFAEVRNSSGGKGTYQISAGPVLGLDFTKKNLGRSLCESAAVDHDQAISELGRGVTGLASSVPFMAQSRRSVRDLRGALADLPSRTKQESEARSRLADVRKEIDVALLLASKAAANSRPKKAIEQIAKARQSLREGKRDLGRACAQLAGS